MKNRYIKFLFIEFAFNNSKLIGIALLDKLMWSNINGIEWI